MSLILFFLLSVLTMAGAFGVVATRNVVYAALFLLLSLLAVAGLYLLIFAQFLALVQVLIYGGAITIVLLFAIMLTRAFEFPRIADNPQRPLAIIAALVVFGVFTGAFLVRAPRVEGPPTGPANLAALGQPLFTQWAIPFEIASLVLLVALIGAIIIARAGGRE